MGCCGQMATVAELLHVCIYVPGKKGSSDLLAAAAADGYDFCSP